MTHSHSSPEVPATAARLRAALEPLDLDALGALLDDDVRWGGEDDAPETCHNRAEVLTWLRRERDRGVLSTLVEAVDGDDAILLAFEVRHPANGGASRERTVFQVHKLRNGRIVDIRGYGSRQAAAVEAGVTTDRPFEMNAHQVVPILNVSNLAASFEWFARLGWTKNWDWRGPDGHPDFGSIGSGGHEIFLSQNSQGGRGGDQGMWLSIWVDDVDAVHAICLRDGLEVLRTPQDEPWGVREMQVRHPDGHVFRVTQSGHAH